MSEASENDIDPGLPLTELAGLRETPAEGFVERIRGSIQRRMVVAHSSDLAMPIFLRTLLEYVTMVFSLFESASHEKRDGTETAPTEKMNQVGDFVVLLLPRIVTGLVVLLIGLILAKLVQRMLRGTLLRLKFDEMLERFGVDNLLKSIGLRGSASRGIARAFYYLLVILFVQAAATIVGLTSVSKAISSFFRFLPVLVTALLIVLIGNTVAQFARRAVEESARESGVDYAPALGRAVGAAISFIVAIMAIAQLGIDTDMIRIIVIVWLSGAALAFALSFGLGSWPVTRNIVAGFYLRKLLRVGEELEVEGARGRLGGITATKTLLEEDGRTAAVSNYKLLEKTVRQ
jgi:small-conductance mechanosensitive channel